MIDTVLDDRSDLFLIAGDLFDHNRIQGDVIDFVYEQLARVPCPTVIIAGNHDCWEERSVLQRMDFRHAGHHVTLLDEAEGKQVEFPELHATVWGRCMLDHDRTNKPMAGSPPRKGEPVAHRHGARSLHRTIRSPTAPRSSRRRRSRIRASITWRSGMCTPIGRCATAIPWPAIPACPPLITERRKAGTWRWWS